MDLAAQRTLHLLAGSVTDAADSLHEPDSNRGHFALRLCHAGGRWVIDVCELWHDVGHYGGSWRNRFFWNGFSIEAISATLATVPGQFNALIAIKDRRKEKSELFALTGNHPSNSARG
jgi:hypothetical protein